MSAGLRACGRAARCVLRVPSAERSSSAADPDVARGRLRLVSYLQPLDPLYFAAGGKSVSISDYSLALTRLPPEQ